MKRRPVSPGERAAAKRCGSLEAGEENGTKDTFQVQTLRSMIGGNFGRYVGNPYR